MANLSQTSTNRPLTNVSLSYGNDTTDFIAPFISPAVPVILESADIYSYGTDNLRITNSIRSKGGKSTGVDWAVSKASHYQLEDHAIHTYLTRKDYENVEKPIEAQRDATEMLTESLMVAKEFSLASSMQDTSVMTNNVTLTGTDQWSDYTNSDPISDITTGLEAIYDATGKAANTLIIPRDTLMVLLYHPKIKDLFPGANQITAGMLKDGIGKIFPDITSVQVGMAQYNSANKGADLSLTRIWTKTLIVAFVEKKPKLKSRSLSYTYQYKTARKVDFLGMNSGDKDLLDRKSDFIRVEDQYDQVLVDVNCGYLIKNAIS